MASPASPSSAAAAAAPDAPSCPASCRICMSPMGDPAAVKGCGHAFCYLCLHTWTSSRRTPLCPICREPITALVLASGDEEAAAPAPAAAAGGADEEPDLSCLDHAFFGGEVDRLFSRARSAHNRLLGDAYGCGRKGGGAAAEAGLDALQDMLGVLGSLQSSLAEEVRFDPQALLQDLYSLDRQLTAVQSGVARGELQQQPGGASALLPGGGGQQRQRWWQQDEDSHSEEVSEDWAAGHDHDHDGWHAAGLARTPGRRPAARHAKKPSGGSGSGSGGRGR
ncbi:BICP0 [Scenedesmus sp. PABB004]|nr:BICP0 [Scenedesmus sp. PABB004]